MKPLIAFVTIAITVMILGLMIYLGAFKHVAIATAEDGPIRIVYKPHLGAYHKIVPDIETVEAWAAHHNEACKASFGEYLDDATLIDEDRLHSNGGCVVTADWTGRLQDTESAGLVYREIPRRLYVVADFDGAPSIGPQKVYPKVKSYLEAQGLKADGPVIEIYERIDGRGLQTHYHFPVQKRE